MQNIRIPVVCALLSVPMLMAPAPALAQVCAVPGSYPTVQSALYDAGCATIQIAAGTFAENLYVFRSVNLQGAGSPVDSAAIQVVYRSMDVVYPSELPAALHCVRDCPTAASMAAYFAPGGSQTPFAGNELILACKAAVLFLYFFAGHHKWLEDAVLAY